MFTTKFVNQFINQVQSLGVNQAGDATNAVKDFYANLKSLRVVFVNASGYGHQASTLIVLQRVIQLGYSNSIQVFYESGVGLTLELLIPGFRNGQTKTLKYMEVTLNFETGVISPGNPLKLTQVDLGITGGMDPSALWTNPSVTFYTNAFLQLQPPGWEKKTAIQHTAYNQLFLSTGVEERLSQVASLGMALFDNLAFNMPDPSLSPQDWELLTEVVPEDGQQGLQCSKAIIDYLGSVKANAPANMLAAYGLASERATFVKEDYSYILALLLAMVEAQSQKPAVMLIIGDLQASFWTNIAAMLNGTFDFDASDESFLPDTRKLITEAAPFITQVTPATNVSFCYCGANGNDQSALTTALHALQQGQILVVNIVSTPPLVFNLLMASCTFPYIFEGQGTATLAMNLGTPFLKMAKFANKNAFQETIYSLPMMEPVVSRSVDYVVLAIRRLCLQSTTRPLPDRYAPLLDFFNSAINPPTNSPNPPIDYFKSLREFFHSDQYDKLVLATRYYQQKYVNSSVHSLIAAPDQALQRAIQSGGDYQYDLALVPSAGAADDSPLATLNQSISANTSNGVLTLYPGAIPSDGSAIASFLAGMLGAATSLTVSDVQTNYVPDTTITVTGTGNLFGSVPLPVSIVFTMASDGTTLLMSFKASGPTLQWSGAPWFAIDNPSLGVSVSDAGTMIFGSLSGELQVDNQKIDLSASIPTADSFLFTGTFANPGPSLDSVFQLVGGIDLTSFIPSPINTLVSLSLQSFSFTYDFTTNTVGVMQIDLQSTPNWNVFGPLTLETLDFTFTVVDPVGERAVSWEAFSTFSLPPGQLQLGVAYPNYAISAEIADGSPPIPLSSIISMFLGGQEVPISGDLTSFNMLVRPDTVTTYSLDMTVDGDWALPPGSANPIFSITELGFGIDGSSDSTNSSQSSVSGYISGSMEMFPDNPNLTFGLTVRATYNQNWVITAQQDDNPIHVTDIIQAYLPPSWITKGMPDIQVSGLSVEIGTGQDGYYILGGSVSVWNIPFLSEPLSATVTAQIGNAFNTSTPSTQFPFGNVNAAFNWDGIDLILGYNYDPTVTSYTLEWEGIQATISKSTATQQWIGTLSFSKDKTLGEMIEKAVSWATGTPYGLASPWNVLNDISLGDFELTFNFTTNQVSFGINIGPIDLGFCTLNAIGVTYDSSSTSSAKVQVVIDGSFLWNVGPDAKQLSWDATKPETTPAGPGGGNKYFDLRLLAMGQHVAIQGLDTATTVEAAIDAMSKLTPPAEGQMPSVAFDANNSWVIGIDAGILALDTGGYCFTGQVVFDDPDLYGLRIKLEGAPAKIFGGLDFEIVYRKINDTLGVYQAELTLPTAMRTIQAGIYTIQLPTFGFEVYTNGDFQIDFGFPWNEDFSRSFTVQAIIYPGIPVMGSGGFYFGKLSSASSNQVPAVTNGTFNPVIVFGFGAQVGFGKSVSYGPLSASFSLTVLGIIQGVFGKWCPFEQGNYGDSGSSQLDGQYYYSITGTLGISAILTGSVDFAIIKASVNLSLLVIAQIQFTSFEPILFTVAASVDVSASVEINLGLFSIKFSFHFSLNIRETFTIGAQGSPPWTIAAQPSGRLDGPLAMRHTPTRRALRALQGYTNPYQTIATSPTWTNLAAPSTKIPLTGYLSLALTAAGDQATALGQQIPCYVSVLAIDAPIPATSETFLELHKQAGASPDSSFEALAKLITRWVIAAFQPNVQQPLTADQVDAIVVSSDDLDGILNWLADDNNGSIPIPTSVIEAMLSDQVLLTLLGPADAPNQSINGAFFPMPLELQLDVPSYNGSPPYQYTFGDYNTLSSTAIPDLQTYFDQIAVQVEKESDSRTMQSVSATNAPLSVAGFVFADYFLLIARQMIQALQNGLKDLKYSLVQGQTPQTIVNAINQTAQLSGEDQFTGSDLFTSNQKAALSASKVVTISGVTYATQAGQSLQTIAALSRFGAGFSATPLGVFNQTNATLLQQGVTVASNGATYKIKGGDSLTDVAIGLKIPLTTLLADQNVLSQTDLLMPYGAVAIPDYTYTTVAGDTLLSIATANGVTPAILGASTSNADIVDLFDYTTVSALDVPHLPQYQAGALIAEAQQTPAINHLASMISRFHFHGLRLPTNGITPNSAGMWVSDQKTLPAAAGLFALTGQQFPIPAIVSTSPYLIYFNTPTSIPWIAFYNGTQQISISVSSTSTECQSIQAITTYVQNNRLVTDYTMLGSDASLTKSAANYSFGSFLQWLSPILPTLTYGAPVPGAVQATIWKFPTSLESHLDRSTHRTNPIFLPQAQTYDDVLGQTVATDIANYGWASVIEFRVKRVPFSADSTASSATYEIVGVGADDITLLENIVAEFSATPTMLSELWLAYPPVGGIGTAGLQSGSANVVFGIAQVNMSTVTNPSSVQMNLMELEQTQPLTPGSLNGNVDFLRLLWEAAITVSGGYFLYYSDQGTGLPDTAFNSSGEATISLIVLYAQETAPSLQNQVYDCMNALILTDPIQGAAALVAVAQPTLIAPAPLTAASDTIADLVSAYYADLGEFVEANSGLNLTSGLALQLNQGVYMVSPFDTAPGGLLADIATYFGMSSTAIQAANPGITTNEWTNGLTAFTSIRLPATTLTVGVSPGGASLESISTYYGCNVVGLAADNQKQAGAFATNQALHIVAGPMVRSSNLPPASQFLGLERPVAPPAPSDPTAPNYAQDLMLNQFSLLGYQIAANQDFLLSNLGVPVGPTGAGGVGAGKMRAPMVLTPDDSWYYEVTLAYSSQLASPKGSGPYDGIGALLQVEYFWIDLYGNTILSDLNMPLSTDTSPLNEQPILIGYTDRLIGLNKWPSCSASWSIVPGQGSASPTIQVPIDFDPRRYLESATNPTWQANASADMVIYQNLLAQLNDPNGIGLCLNTTLVSQPISILASDIILLTNWIGEIVAFLNAQASGSSGTVPPTPYTLSEAVPANILNQTQIFELTCSLTITRTGGIVEGEYMVLGGVQSDSTVLSPTGATSSQGLTAFASQFQQAFTTTGVSTLQVAVGIDRYAGGSATTQTLWALWLGLEADQGMNFSVESNSATPYIYAPSPISTSLQSRTDVPIYNYTTGQVIDLQQPTSSQTFANIDLDQWTRTLFASVDGLLTPEFTSSILVLDSLTGSNYMDALQKNKEQLALMYSAQMAPVFQDQAAAPTDTVQENFRQQMLIQLENAYRTQAALQYAADIVAQPAAEGQTAPNFYGQVTQTMPTTGGVSIAFTPVKMPLAPATAVPLAFLLTTPNQTAGFASSSFVALDLAYAVTDIEHQISSVPGIAAYNASSWLKELAPVSGVMGAPGTLSASLGTVDVPMPLRSYPANPVLVQQSGTQTEPSSTILTDFTQWTYSISYSMPYHYPQDISSWSVLFNIAPTEEMMQSGFLDSFNAMAEFITVFPQVQGDLVNYLAAITAETTDPTIITTAETSLESLIVMLDYITGLKNSVSSLQSEPRRSFSAISAGSSVSSANTPYAFNIQELTGLAGKNPAALIVQVELTSSPFESSVNSMPVVLIKPDTYTVTVLSQSTNQIRYYYVDNTGTVLDAKAGRSLADRTVQLSGIQILDYQNALASVNVTRNQSLVPDRDTSELFIYETPEIAFANTLQPTISTNEPINLALIGSSSGQPIQRSLDAHLSALFEVLAGESSDVAMTVQFTTFYTYILNQQASANALNVTLPVLTQAPLSVTLQDVSTPGSESLTQMITDLSTAINTWYVSNQPLTNGAQFNSQLIILTNQGTQSQNLMPLLALTNLYLNLTDIVPPLG